MYFDSADAWANPLLFQFDEENKPLAVAGCPPDGFFRHRTALGKPALQLGISQEHGIYLVDTAYVPLYGDL